MSHRLLLGVVLYSKQLPELKSGVHVFASLPWAIIRHVENYKNPTSDLVLGQSLDLDV